MSRDAELAAVYQPARPRLVRIAYAVLGSHAEAEDVVSECWLRLVKADRIEPIRDVEGWATVVVARAALDVARSARSRREVYPGQWLPEPEIDLGTTVDPADRVTLDDTISYALLVVLETLTPAQRTAWVLHDLFRMSFEDVANVVGRSPAAVRQLAARARVHIQDRTPRVSVDAVEHATVVNRFLQAAVGGDLAILVAALDPDVTLVSDGGGEVSAARQPVRGAANVARFLYGIVNNIDDGATLRIVSINGAPGLGLFDGAKLTTAVVITVVDALITRIDFIRAPAKLPH